MEQQCCMTVKPLYQSVTKLAQAAHLQLLLVWSSGGHHSSKHPHLQYPRHKQGRQGGTSKQDLTV
jgi:hypothetical protein